MINNFPFFNKFSKNNLKDFCKGVQDDLAKLEYVKSTTPFEVLYKKEVYDRCTITIHPDEETYNVEISSNCKFTMNKTDGANLAKILTKELKALDKAIQKYYDVTVEEPAEETKE